VASVVPIVRSAHPLLERLGVVFDSDTRTLERCGRRRQLAPREAALLSVLLRSQAGAVIRRDDLLDAIWGNGDVCEDALTVIVSRLRRHFDRLGIDEPVIETVPRCGYRLGSCQGSSGGLREARRDGRLGRTLGLAALVVSALALAVSCLALVLAAR
jgi:hypothetical protein